MNLRKFIILCILSFPGALHAAPATVTLSVPGQIFSGQVMVATVTVNTGSGVLGAADFTITYDPSIVTFNGLGAAASPFQGNLYANSAVPGHVHVLALNGASTASPTGSVQVATMTFIASGAASSALSAEVNLVIDTVTLAYAPVTVNPGAFLVRIDQLPPRTTRVVGTPQAGSDPVVVSTVTPLNLSAVDDALATGDGVGAGIQGTWYSMDGQPFVLYNGPFFVGTPGAHSLSYYSVDLIGHSESPTLTSVFVDIVPPVSQIVYTPAPFIDGLSQTIISGDTQVSFTATDDPAGVALIQYGVDTSVLSPFSSAITLPEGAHTLYAASQDAVGNVEALRSFAVLTDTTAPVTTLNSSGDPMITTTTVFSLSAVDPQSHGVASGVQLTWVSVDAGTFMNYTAPIVFPTGGQHTLQWYSVDNVGNTEVVASTQVVISIDNVPPQTQLEFSVTPILYNGFACIGPLTTLSLSAVDFGVPASGVAWTQYALNGGSFLTYTGPFGVPEGFQRIHYQSQDNAGNLESVQISTIVVDATPPVSTLLAGGIVLSSSPVTVSTSTLFSLLVADAFAGIRESHLTIDGTVYTGSLSSFSVPVGTHTLVYFSIDNVGNTETARTQVVIMVATTITTPPPTPTDTVPPQTQIQFSVTPFVNGSQTFITASNQISFSAQDLGSPASGVAFTQKAVDGSSFTVVTSTFTLLEGIHTVQYRSQDNAGNLETTHSAALRVDNTVPISELNVGQPNRHLLFHIMLITPNTPLSVTAVDPVKTSVASGVKDTWVAIDAGSFQRVTGSFFIGSPHGCLHVVRYYSRDNVGNVEQTQLVLAIVLPNSHAFSGHSFAPLPRGVAMESSDDVSKSQAFVQGTSTVTYHLEFAAGAKALNGFAPMKTEWGLLDPAAASHLNPPHPDTQYTIRLRSSDGTLETADAVADPNLIAALLNGLLGAPPIDAFGQRDVFVFPNPARAGAKPTLHAEVGIADRVEIKIFDAAGRQVHEAALMGSPTLINGQYAYEYVWDGSIPSGVYFYAIRAKKAGVDDIKVQGKFAVVR